MQPTLNPEESLGRCDYVLVEKWNESVPFRRGEIVALRFVNYPMRVQMLSRLSWT